MSKGGRKGKYHEWLTEDGLLRIESWASDGLTNEDIAHNIGIAPETFSRWLNKYNQLNQALKKGREPVVRKLENALINKALGFEYDETETYIEEVEGVQKKKVKKITRYSLPDSSALIFLLKNYKPNKYRNYNDLTKKQIEAEIKKLEAEAKVAKHEADKLMQSGQVNDLLESLLEVKLEGDSDES